MKSTSTIATNLFAFLFSHKDRGDKKERSRERPKEIDKERRSRLSSPSSNDGIHYLF